MIGGIFLLLGSNQGDKRQHLLAARAIISDRLGMIVGASGIYTSPAWGYTAQPDFLNQVIEISTQMPPKALLESILAIENALGRKRSKKWGPRTIDIDILYYGNTILDHPNLSIPHPELHNRRFTLVPLVEIAPDWQHPVMKQTNAQLLEICPDEGIVIPATD